jgi:hypothetical protein
MTKRKNQTSQDISELAARFRAAWNTGQVLRSWLKIHGPEIQELAKTGHWSWENLGRVLTEAGITYQTGTPWTGENLRRNLLRAQLPGKRELKLLRGSDGPPEPAPSSPASPAPPVREAPAALRAGIASERPGPAVPEFELIRRAIETGKAPVELASLSPRRARRNLSPDELRAIALGRSAKR